MEKTKYISDFLKDSFTTWGRKKIFLLAPVGMGKSTYIVEQLIPYYRSKGSKVLILCNRRLLRMQYWYDLVQKYDYYDELTSSVVIASYQEIAERFRATGDEEIFDDIDVVVCDEVHYFYSDSDFNGYGTYILLQLLVKKCISKTMVFMSATATEAFKLIEETLLNARDVLRNEFNEQWRIETGYELGMGSVMREDCMKFIKHDFTDQRDFSRFTCIALPDMDSLCKTIAETEGKSLIFIDNKEMANDIRYKLINKYHILAKDIAVLNADNLENPENQELVETLAIAHRLKPKVLITSSVLDNGVSVHDPDVRRVAIITDSKISFIQMLGRIRAESSEKCDLYFLIRPASYFKNRKEQYEKLTTFFGSVNAKDVQQNPYKWFSAVWENNPKEDAEMLRKALILTNRHIKIYTVPPSKRIEMQYGNCILESNEAARRKVSDMFLMESRLYALAIINPLKVIYEQMDWMHRRSDELNVLSSSFLEDKKKEMIEFLLTVKEFSSKQISQFKKELVSKFRAAVFPDIIVKNGGLSQEKLKLICSRCGLVYDDNSLKDGKKVYNITNEQAGVVLNESSK